MFLLLEDNQGDILDTFKLQRNMLDGMVIFRDCYAKLITDDRTLETGVGLWVEFATNGIYERPTGPR